LPPYITTGITFKPMQEHGRWFFFTYFYRTKVIWEAKGMGIMMGFEPTIFFNMN